MRIKFDHVYVVVDDLDKAIEFYEKLLDTKVTTREGNNWADFTINNQPYFGIINQNQTGDKPTMGSNSVIVFKTDDVDLAYKLAVELQVEVVFEPMQAATDYYYRCFQCKDPFGNIIEITDYNR